MTFLLPLELADPEVRPGLEMAAKGARASGTPFISFFTPAEMLALAREAGFRDAQHVSAADPRRALLRGQDRRPAPAEQLRGTAGRDDVVVLGARHSSGASSQWTASFQLAHERAGCARSKGP